MSDLERRTGVVVDFDEHVGLGHVDGDGETFLFHCVEILDGSRKIADRKSTRLNSSHSQQSRMPSSA